MTEAPAGPKKNAALSQYISHTLYLVLPLLGHRGWGAVHSSGHTTGKHNISYLQFHTCTCTLDRFSVVFQPLRAEWVSSIYCDLSPHRLNSLLSQSVVLLLLAETEIQVRGRCAQRVHLVVGTVVTALRGPWDSSLITGRAGSTAMRRGSAVRGARKMARVK